jgi:hypothetical protein
MKNISNSYILPNGKLEDIIGITKELENILNRENYNSDYLQGTDGEI